MGDLRAELLAAFEAELADHLAAVRAALADADAGRAVDLRDITRRAHSLKGAARAVEQPETEALAHQAEALLLEVEDGARALDTPLIAELRTLFDRIQDSAAGGPRNAGAAAEPVSLAPPGRLRVSGDNLERIARSLHELSMQVQEAGAFTQDLLALQAELDVLARLAQRQADDELSRRIGRAAAEAGRIRSEQERHRERLDRTSLMLERDAEQVLMLPVETLFEGHERMVRELAGAQGKQAVMRASPTRAEADRRVLEALREPLLHLLRNAVSHGIEPPDERERQGKPIQGEVSVTALIEGGRLSLRVEDDGRGLDYARIEARAREAGLIGANEPRPGEAELRAMIFVQGFSTAAAVDELSGRGIGLSVVAETARRLHGSVTVAPRPAGGTIITLSVPAALTRQPLLFVEAGGEPYALPAAAVAQLLHIDPSALERSEGMDVLPLGGEAVRVAALGDLVGAPAGEAETRRLPALLLHAEGRRLVLTVDSLLDVRAMVVGDPTAIAAEVPLVYGTVLAEQGVVIVLDPRTLLGELPRTRDPARRRELSRGPTPKKRILVVDDSITTRTLEKTILEAQGYAVLVSVDGLAALEMLRSGPERVDLVVADVEMPRMDGFSLLTAIRNDPALSALPVVMMTSRNNPEDIERGLELGANAYVTKQEFDQGTLISVVQQLI